MPSPRRVERASLLVAVVLFVIEQIRVLIAVGVRYTSEDQTIFWYVAKDYLHLRFPEPLFYGSPYSSHIEALIAAPLLGVGVGPQIAVPVVSAGLTAAPWILLCWAAWRLGHRRVAIGILAFTYTLPVNYDAINTQAAHGAGVAVVAIAASLLLLNGYGVKSCAAFGLLSSLSVLTYPNAAIIAGPVALYLVVRYHRKASTWVAAAAGALTGAVLYLLARLFYAHHPEYVLHPQWPVSFDWNHFVDGMRNLDRHLGDVTPVPLSAWEFLILLSALLVVYAYKTKRGTLPSIGALVLLGVIASLGMPKTHDGSAVYTFAYARAYLALPLTLAFLAIVAANSLTPTPANEGYPRLAWSASGVVLLAIGIWRQVALDAGIARVFHSGRPIVSFVPTRQVLRHCSDLRQAAELNRAELVIETKSRTDAYACGALWYGTLPTIFPPYDRRTRDLLDERDRTRRVVLVVDARQAKCVELARHGIQCKMISSTPSLAVVQWASGSSLELAAKLGIPVRRL